MAMIDESMMREVHGEEESKVFDDTLLMKDDSFTQDAAMNKVLLKDVLSLKEIRTKSNEGKKLNTRVMTQEEFKRKKTLMSIRSDLNTKQMLEVRRDDSLADLAQPLCSTKKMEHVTHEIFLVVHLALKLWSYLGLGWRWTWNCARLVLYATILMPGFLQMVFYYFYSVQVRRSLIYGRKPRNRLDLYIPQTESVDKSGWPVVIFITGGAWTIGYKAWGALLGRRLSEAGILVVSLDYRNFPQGSCQDMLEDINTGMRWVFRKIHIFGGSSDNIYLCGQSAGGHLAAVAMLTQVERCTLGFSLIGKGSQWNPQDLKGFVGVSGAYSLPDLADHLDKRGLYKSMFESIMSIEGETMLDLLSPIWIAKQLKDHLQSYLPEVLLLHGKEDKSVPYQAAEDFSSLLSHAGVRCKCKIYEGKSHTQPLIEDPLRGGQDSLMEDILSIVFQKSVSIDQRPLVPKILTRMASFVCPF